MHINLNLNKYTAGIAAENYSQWRQVLAKEGSVQWLLRIVVVICDTGVEIFASLAQNVLFDNIRATYNNGVANHELVSRLLDVRLW